MALRNVQFSLRSASEKLVLRLQKIFCEEILVLGDSHAGIFSSSNVRSTFPTRYFNVVSVGGATVSGLENPNSKTQAMPIFMDSLSKSKAKNVIVLIGEVDTGFVIWYRAEKYQKDVSEMLANATDNYKKLLLSLSQERRVICMSTPLPTIKDGQNWGEVANARRDISATQLDRTKLTVLFNKTMKDFCLENGIAYLDFDDESIGENGLVASRLLNKNIVDHHYDSRAYRNLIVPKLKGFIY